ncbi:MAG: hypothetical protein HY770_02740, partial [Chitinivibrionia bacterium]|nr:hypothetical protein [Chitinivibrionia bacterium]
MKLGVKTQVCRYAARFAVFAVLAAAAGIGGASELPEGFMPLQQAEAILKKTLVITRNPDLRVLTPAERGAAQRLLDVGYLFQRLYEQSLHHQAGSAYRSLAEIDLRIGSPLDTQYLLDLFY